MRKCVDKNSRNKQGKTPLDFVKGTELEQCVLLNTDKVNIKMKKYKYFPTLTLVRLCIMSGLLVLWVPLGIFISRYLDFGASVIQAIKLVRL